MEKSIKNIPSLLLCCCSGLSLIAFIYLKGRLGGDLQLFLNSLIATTGLGFVYGIVYYFKAGKKQGTELPIQHSDAHIMDERFEAFMQNSPAVAWIKDSSGRYTYINEEFCLKFSVEKDNVIGKTDYDILNHEVVDLITQHDNYIVETGKKMEIYEELPMPDGIMHHWWVHKFPINSSSGEIFSAGIGFDVTDKKNAEEGLAESEKLYRLISENMRDLICLHEPGGTYKYVSPSVTEILGYYPEELLNKSPLDFLDAEDAAKFSDRNFLSAVDESASTINRFRKKDGTFIWVETVSKPIFSESGKILQHQSVSRDISHRKVIENEISCYMESLQDMNRELVEAKDLAEQSVKIKEEFLANTSHEIRTPMNAIIGLTRLMLDSQLTLEHREYLEAIAKSGDTLMTVLNDILDLSKLEAGKMTFEEISFSPKDNIRFAVDLLKQKAAEKGILIDYNIRDEVPATVIGDPVRLSQVIMNLLSNAIKFTHFGGVKLDLRVMKEDIRPGFVGLCFTVSDTGIGIAPDKLVSIFNSFTQGNNSISRKYGGTGLGLAIVKRLVELQNGVVEVSSEINVGSRFALKLFFKTDDQKSGVQDARAQSMSNKLLHKRGLLVEDNAINQLVARQVFKDFGMDINVASNGLEAIKLLEKNPYDIIFMDLMMPEMDGFEATTYIREKMPPAVNKIPIMAMSASALHSEMGHCLEIGMNDYISKPFDTRNLFNKIVKLINMAASTVGGVETNNMEKITNLNYLRDLAEGSNSFIEEILTMFIDIIPKSLNELDESLGKGDWDNMKLVSHKMKPSYGFVGVKSAEDIMQRIEKNVSEMPDKMLLGELLSHARAISDQCVVELKDELTHLDTK